MSTADAPSVRNLSGLTSALVAALFVYLIASGVSAWANWEQILLIGQIEQGQECTQAQVLSNHIRKALCALFHLVAFVCTALLFMRWTYLTKKNAMALGATDMEFSPAWSVGWYFIPIATLWKPYQALKETFMASSPTGREAWRNAERPWILPLWWGLWLVSSEFGNLGSVTAFHKTELADLGISTWLSLIRNLLDVPLAVVVIILANTLRSWQAAKIQ